MSLCYDLELCVQVLDPSVWNYGEWEIKDSSEVNMSDSDQKQISEWLEGLEDVIEFEGPAQAIKILEQLITAANYQGITLDNQVNTPYLNTIPAAAEPDYPGDLELEQRILALLRWNAMAMVVRGGKRAPELGGHIASFASSAMLYEVGFNHFFNAPHEGHGGDLVFIQGHSAPGIYARSFLEGRLTAAQLDHFREEVEVDGIASYPHPWLMPDYWQFPTVSMGLGPIQGIYMARFLKYLHNRGLADTSQRKVWVYCGDGEMDEPESQGALHIASREGLDNLIFVINCNLQRLDGPVRGNGKIIQDLEGSFKGSGWEVIKLIWDEHWQPLLEHPHREVLFKLMNETVDGEYQNFKAKTGAYGREHFFAKYPETAAMVADWSDEQIGALNYGGHDLRKVYAAYHRATQVQGKPVVILAKTVKGFGMGEVGQGKNTTHQQKKFSTEQIAEFKQRFNLPLQEAQVAEVAFYRPEENSPEINYLKQQRQKLGGYLPARREKSTALAIPGLELFASSLTDSGDREISTTMAFVRILSSLLKEKQLKERIVPIIPDECRTFGMEGMFRQFGIYSPVGQLYTPVDADQLMYYREDKKGQLLNEGISEAGGFSSWIAAATSYSTCDLPMIPFFIYYSMFGFQRVMDLAWAAGDMRARGFLLGGTAGRTTLAGEGLQHQDCHSLNLAAMVPNCISYDPTFSYELAVIIHDGLRRMYQEQEDVYYYITLMNENYHHPAMPEWVEQDILTGLYRYSKSTASHQLRAQLLGSGTILREVIQAAEILEQEYNVACDERSATSFNELGREVRAVERHNQLHPDQPKISHVQACLNGCAGPVIAATDYIRAYSDQIRQHVSAPYTVLGTDGFGRSDTRKQLRHFFEVDSKAIVYATLATLFLQQQISEQILVAAKQQLGIDPNKADPVTL